jgi:hypothetical protein
MTTSSIMGPPLRLIDFSSLRENDGTFRINVLFQQDREIHVSYKVASVNQHDTARIFPVHNPWVRCEHCTVFSSTIAGLWQVWKPRHGRTVHPGSRPSFLLPAPTSPRASSTS